MVRNTMAKTIYKPSQVLAAKQWPSEDSSNIAILHSVNILSIDA